MKRKRDGFVPLGDVRRRYRYGRVARRLRPPPRRRRVHSPASAFASVLGRYNFGWRPAHAHTPRPTVTGETGARRTFHLKISTITAGHLATQVVAVRSAESTELVQRARYSRSASLQELR